MTNSDDLTAQLGALIDANIQMQRSCSVLLAQVTAQRQSQAGPASRALYDHTALSRIDSVPEVPQSARASILGAGVPIPHRPYRGDPRLKVLASTKARLFKDGWPDCDDTDMHASRLTEAMLRVSCSYLAQTSRLITNLRKLGMEDLDNFMTEVGNPALPTCPTLAHKCLRHLVSIALIWP